MTLATDPREAAREWIAETITKHLYTALTDHDRIQHVAAEIEQTAYEHNMAVEMAVELAAEWCEEQNEGAGASLSASDEPMPVPQG